jgi:hypothetical protein
MHSPAQKPSNAKNLASASSDIFHLALFIGRHPKKNHKRKKDLTLKFIIYFVFSLGSVLSIHFLILLDPFHKYSTAFIDPTKKPFRESLVQRDLLRHEPTITSSTTGNNQ